MTNRNRKETLIDPKMKNIIALILLIFAIYMIVKTIFTILTIVLILIAAYLFLADKEPVNKALKKFSKKKSDKR